MKDKNVRKAILNTSAVFLLIIGIMLYFYIKDPDRNYLYYQTKQYEDVVVAAKDILPGEEIGNESIMVIEVEVTELLNNDTLFCTSVDEFVGKKALYPVKMGQLLQKDYFLEKEKWFDGKYEYALEVDIPGTVANSIKVGDYVDINVNYDKNLSIEELYETDVYENFDIVISKVMIENLKDSNGLSYENYLKQNINEEFLPSYMIVNLAYDQIDDYLAAKDYGSVFLIKYGDITAEANKTTYNNGRSKRLDKLNYEDEVSSEEVNNSLDIEDTEDLGGD